MNECLINDKDLSDLAYSIFQYVDSVEKSTLDYDFEICCAETLFEKLKEFNIKSLHNEKITVESHLGRYDFCSEKLDIFTTTKYLSNFLGVIEMYDVEIEKDNLYKFLSKLLGNFALKSLHQVQDYRDAKRPVFDVVETEENNKE